MQKPPEQTTPEARDGVAVDTVDTAAARLFWRLIDIIGALDDEIPPEEQASYAPIIVLRLAAWLISHGDNTEAEVAELIKIHQAGLESEACRPMEGEEGKHLDEFARSARLEQRSLFAIEPQGHA